MTIVASAPSAATGLVGAAHAAMTRTEIEAQEDRITAKYKAAKAGCDRLAGNAKDICNAEAKQRHGIN